MNKNRWIAIGLALLMMGVSGCSTEAGSNTDEAKTAESAKSETTRVEASVESDEDETSTPDESAVKAVSEDDMEMAQNSMIIGKIVSVYGNYIEVEKADLPDKMLERMTGAGGSSKDSNKNGSGEDQTNIASAMSGGAGMAPGGGGPQGSRGGGGNASSDFEFTGEVVNVMIPVGSDISSMSDDSLELTFDSLSKGMVVRIKVDLEMTKDFQNQTEDETFFADNVLVME